MWATDAADPPGREDRREIELDAVWCYVQVSQIPKFTQLLVHNRMLMETFEDQTNLVHMKANGKMKSLFLTKSESSGALDW